MAALELAIFAAPACCSVCQLFCAFVAMMVWLGLGDVCALIPMVDCLNGRVQCERYISTEHAIEVFGWKDDGPSEADKNGMIFLLAKENSKAAGYVFEPTTELAGDDALKANIQAALAALASATFGLPGSSLSPTWNSSNSSANARVEFAAIRMSLFINENIMEVTEDVTKHSEKLLESEYFNPETDYFYGIDDWSTTKLRIGAVFTLVLGVGVAMASLAHKLSEGLEDAGIFIKVVLFIQKAGAFFLAKAINSTMDKYTCQPEVEGSGVYQSNLNNIVIYYGIVVMCSCCGKLCSQIAMGFCSTLADSSDDADCSLGCIYCAHVIGGVLTILDSVFAILIIVSNMSFEFGSFTFVLIFGQNFESGCLFSGGGGSVGTVSAFATMAFFGGLCNTILAIVAHCLIGLLMCLDRQD